MSRFCLALFPNAEGGIEKVVKYIKDNNCITGDDGQSPTEVCATGRYCSKNKEYLEQALDIKLDFLHNYSNVVL